MRQVLQLSEKHLISLDDEISTLKLYLQLEQLRMQDNFSFIIDIEEGLEHEVEIPPLLLQPFVENAIIHGLKNSSKQNKHLHLKAEKSTNKIIFTIEDNGIGREESIKNTINRNHHTSMGIRLTDERLKMLEHVLPIKTNYFYQDLVNKNGNSSGTRVTIELAYRNLHI